MEKQDLIDKIEMKRAALQREIDKLDEEKAILEALEIKQGA